MLCIVIPFREQAHFDRHAQLDALVQKLRQGVRCEHCVVVVEQCDDGHLFNRGKLLNVGFRLMPPHCSTLIFHDVDLIPCDQLLQHYTEAPGVCHLGARWARYNDNPKYFGGVLRIDDRSFRKINGFPNTFWGWGGEDDALYRRVIAMGLPITVPHSGKYTDMERMTLRHKLDLLKDEGLKCMDKWEQLRDDPRSWRCNGISSVDFHVMRNTLCDGYMRYTVDIRYPPVENIASMIIRNRGGSDARRKKKRKNPGNEEHV